MEEILILIQLAHLGAFACGLGHTDIAYVLLNGQIWFNVPETLYFETKWCSSRKCYGKRSHLKNNWRYRHRWCCKQVQCSLGETGIEKMSIVESRIDIN